MKKLIQWLKSKRQKREVIKNIEVNKDQKTPNTSTVTIRKHTPYYFYDSAETHQPLTERETHQPLTERETSFEPRGGSFGGGGADSSWSDSSSSSSSPCSSYSSCDSSSSSGE